jgi:large subunit ribosomal protein L35
VGEECTILPFPFRDPSGGRGEDPFLRVVLGTLGGVPVETTAMPKLKTNKSTKKRFKVSKNLKVTRWKPGRRHLLSVKSGNQRRRMRRPGSSSNYDTRRILRLLCLR